MPETILGHADALNALAHCSTGTLKAFAESLLADGFDISVEKNRTGLVMVPMRDTVEGTAFHLGETLVAEARVSALGRTGYGMRIGHDVEAALAMSIIDAAFQAGYAADAISAFLAETRQQLAAADSDRLRDIEATRVNMETF